MWRKIGHKIVHVAVCPNDSYEALVRGTCTRQSYEALVRVTPLLDRRMISLWKLYFINARMIGKWRESLIIHPISDLVTRCRWLWVGNDNVVVVCVNDKTLVYISNGKTSVDPICFTVKRLIVLQTTIPAGVDFVKHSWKKERKCFGQHSHCHWHIYEL